MGRATGLGALAGAALMIGAGAAPAQEAPARVQAALEHWLAERREAEGVTGVAAYVSFGGPGPAIEAFAGRTGRDPSDPPVDQSTLFHMGSTSKSFAAAVILMLEAEGRLSIADTIGQWLPEYPAWQDVTLRQLLSMTSRIPNFSETEAMSRTWVDEPYRDLTAAELVAMAYPSATNDLPVTRGYHYSNTNYVLASMIAEKATGQSYADLLDRMIFRPRGLHSTFYTGGTYPPEEIERLAHGYFENPGCAEYQPDCATSWNAPMLGRDIRPTSLSWAQAAGGAIADARDVDRWIRAIFTGAVVPEAQRKEWFSLVSTRTGEPIAEVDAENPQGFGLGLARGILGPYGPQWFYEGMTLGFRTLYVYFEDEDLLITVQTNSQPADGQSLLRDAVIAIHDTVIAAKPD